MDKCIEISEDEDDFDEHLRVINKKKAQKRTISISSDEDVTLSESNNETVITSDDEDMPAVEVNSRKNSVIRKLFPSVSKQRDDEASTSKIPETLTKPKQPAIVQAIAGVSVQLPVIPYPCQKALMSTMITAIKKGKNCLLESPTGSGKTLALLCGALAWQQHERNTIAQTSAQQLISNYSNIEGSKDFIDYVASPMKNNEPYSCQVFNRTNFGERSIYDQPVVTGVGNSTGIKRMKPCEDHCEDNQEKDLVTIHKKQRIDDTEFGADGKHASAPSTPRKGIDPQQPDTPDKSVPTIYYGARTHKQLEQVIKEFGRTTYCGQVKMTVLSSREYSCIREHDKSQWSNKNDMCRACVKPVSTPNKQTKGSNCKFYDNRTSMSHRSLPPAFDLEDLVATGTELNSCPYYAARAMAASSDIVFCPYNYLIDPGIRSSMQIDLENQVVVIDEAHNIEDICRDAATFTFTRDDILAAIKELETVAHYRFANQDVMTYIEVLIKALKNWDEWFHRHAPLVEAQPVNYGEATHLWDVEEFAGTLQKLNIGETAYNQFQQSASSFCQRLREDPRTLVGVSQLTGSLVESLDTALGYLFRNSCANMEDFKPVLIKNLPNRYNRSSTVSLRLICLNPALVFAGLRPARCVVLASGTLTPHTSLHSELGTEFPYKSNPGHVISKDRVWVGTLSTGPDGGALQCTSSGTREARAQDALGAAVLAVARRTPHGLLAFLPSYHLMDTLATRWQETGLWAQLADTKHVYQESRNVRDHNDNMDDYYESAKTEKGALLFAVYRGKVSEGMDFKDHQARAVIAIGVPYPNLFDVAVKEKMAYNDRRHRAVAAGGAGGTLLPGREWLRVQAYRALNQAAGRCVRHRGDWGAVLLVDARYRQPHYTEHLAKWLLNFLGDNHHTFDSLMASDRGLASFMQCMTVRSQEEEM